MSVSTAASIGGRSRRIGYIAVITLAALLAASPATASAQAERGTRNFSVERRDSLRTLHELTRHRFGYKGLHLGMRFRDIYRLVDIVTPYENACKPYGYQWADQPMLRCSIFGRLRINGSRIDVTVNLASADTSGPVVALQIRHEVADFRQGAEHLLTIVTEWQQLRPEELRVQDRFYSPNAQWHPRVCSVRVWLEENRHLSADARLWCPDRPQPRFDPIEVFVDIFDRSDRAR